MGNFNLKSIWKQNGGTGGSTNLEQRVQAIENDITTNRSELARVDSVVNTNSNNIVNLGSRATNLETNAVKITGDQSIAGVKTITATGEALKFNSGNNNSAYMAGYKSGNTRIWYFGKGSSTDDNFIIGSTAEIKLEAARAIHCNSKKLTNVADPAANTDAATKQYVDNRIKYRTLNTNINASSTYSVEPTAGYQVINVMVGRKRSNDGMYFFEYQTTLNKQVFWGSDNKFKVFNQGNVSGFSNNEFKIVITEMKV